jgi:hypothetical protein
VPLDKKASLNLIEEVGNNIVDEPHGSALCLKTLKLRCNVSTVLELVVIGAEITH